MENREMPRAGVYRLPHERWAIHNLWEGRFVNLSLKILDKLCKRCSASGKCVNDLYDRFVIEHTSADELGCPAYCHLLGDMESKYLENPAFGAGNSDEILF